MRTLQDIKEEVAKEMFKKTWLEISEFSNDNNVPVIEDSGAIDEVAKRYATECCKASLEIADERAKSIHKDDPSFDSIVESINDLNITSPENIVLL